MCVPNRRLSGSWRDGPGPSTVVARCRSFCHQCVWGVGVCSSVVLSLAVSCRFEAQTVKEACIVEHHLSCSRVLSMASMLPSRQVCVASRPACQGPWISRPFSPTYRCSTGEKTLLSLSVRLILHLLIHCVTLCIWEARRKHAAACQYSKCPALHYLCSCKTIC